MGGALAGGMGTDDIPLAAVPITFPGGLTSASSLGVDGLVGLDEWGLLPPSNVVYGTPRLELEASRVPSADSNAVFVNMRSCCVEGIDINRRTIA